ncbi:uncharacterized protein LOC123315948 [Coccinella septempunctata]|uniref:uncharacterized protein LOC123315947 n=1 Tax=Coccinella septempunctata TaxID=41139 RepID=UPI001D086A5C|nr:uncharacterized protein LOC123315947 [Coccinella septempunctata]XP_044757791.1 uncharacterized protein LOC123315948 [Coccinella septempunctata]
MGHQGVEVILNELRQRFWILQARKAIKRAMRYCPICSLRRAISRVTQMGQLPDFRLKKPQPQRAFVYTGIDFFGHFEVTIGRRREKRYGVLFTCMSVGAIHIEIAETLNTDSNLLAIKRFMSRRGKPQMFLTDNGTNFHAAEKELKKAYEDVNLEVIRQGLCAESIDWKFIPPGSPHMGGAWERMVRSVKTTLSIILKDRSPRQEVFHTVMIEAEHIVNSRPLTYISSSPEDEESLTPNHFLIGSSSILKPPGLFDGTKWNVRKQWLIAENLNEHFWNRWVKEYIPTLTKRTKWFEQNQNLKEGDLIVLMDSKLPRNNWPKGVVYKTYPGKDGKVRVVDIKLKSGIYRRPVSKLCKVECLEMGEEIGSSRGGENVED